MTASKGVITNYTIVPQSGGGVCVIGEFKGRAGHQTTRLLRWTKNLVQTKSGSIYELRNPKPGVWGIQLQIKRPSEYEALKHLI